MVENMSGAISMNVPSAGKETTSPAEGEKNTKDAETNLQKQLIDLLGIEVVEQYHSKKFDGEESNHEEASDTGTAPKQQQQVIPQRKLKGNSVDTKFAKPSSRETGYTTTQKLIQLLTTECLNLNT
ncbi:hypothetical protein Tco_1056798 [Tanacetum coccineum]|uniref:Uncharacterized protein n=1 Tax=Tanacetum coccineum TaxID=301880 RepID=A0ABQ5H3R6_9ASTR